MAEILTVSDPEQSHAGQRLERLADVVALLKRGALQQWESEEARQVFGALSQAQLAQRAAEELVRVKNEFLCLAAHDLCQPVQSLELVMDAIGQALAVPADCVVKLGELERLSTQANAFLARMHELLRMLLEIARLESGSVRTHAEPVPVAELFVFLDRQFAPVARAKALAFEAMPSPHVIETDPTLLRDLLANLVSNALRYTPHGEVHLQSTVGIDGSLRLVVRDTGVGIPPEELARVFEDFRRLGQAERLASEGFGLGLGIVRRLSRLLGLPVKVESEVGRGSTFAVEVPAAKVFGRNSRGEALDRRDVATVPGCTAALRPETTVADRAPPGERTKPGEDTIMSLSSRAAGIACTSRCPAPADRCPLPRSDRHIVTIPIDSARWEATA